MGSTERVPKELYEDISCADSGMSALWFTRLGDAFGHADDGLPMPMPRLFRNDRPRDESMLPAGAKASKTGRYLNFHDVYLVGAAMHRDASFTQVPLDSVDQMVSRTFVIATACCPNYRFQIGWDGMVRDYYGERPRQDSR